MHDLSTTIVAIATPPGRGGVGCLRVSGREALEVAAGLFRPAVDGPPPRAGGPPRFGRFLSRDGTPLDHGYFVAFAASSSFTGEPAVELWTHGSPAVLAELAEAAVIAGAVPAGPGEFTYRALCRGRLDLARAEAVRDLVEARTLYQARVAFAQAEGALSRRLGPLRDELEEWIARGEAAVEFVEESETHLPRGELGRAIERLRDGFKRLLSGFGVGRVIREGATVAIIGRPNVGKSSLFNRLLDQERAIVAALEGTTRDTLEEEVSLDGVPARLIDTAGMREAEHAVEREGVRRAEAARDQADLVVLVLDGSRPMEPGELDDLEGGPGDPGASRILVVVNKSDLPHAPNPAIPCRCVVRVSALTGDGVHQLRRELRSRLVGTGPLEDPVLTNARHAGAIAVAAEALERAAAGAQAGLSEELVIEDLRYARSSLGTITGEFSNDDLYGRIFSTFCIGK